MFGFESYLDDLASGRPTPGGGAATAITGAQACALLSMACELSINKKSLAEFQQENQEILGRLEKCRTRFLQLAEDDIQAFNKVMAAYQSKSPEPLETALDGAAKVALDMAEAVQSIWNIPGRLRITGNPNLISDVVCGELHLKCCLECAFENVRINQVAMKTQERATFYETQVARLRKDLLISI